MGSWALDRVKEKDYFFFHEGEDAGMGVEEDGIEETFSVVDIFLFGEEVVVTVTFRFLEDDLEDATPSTGFLQYLVQFCSLVGLVFFLFVMSSFLPFRADPSASIFQSVCIPFCGRFCFGKSGVQQQLGFLCLEYFYLSSLPIIFLVIVFFTCLSRR